MFYTESIAHAIVLKYCPDFVKETNGRLSLRPASDWCLIVCSQSAAISPDYYL